MTPHQIELVKKLDQEVKNLSILMQHTEVGDSLTLKDIRHYLYLLNKEVKEPIYTTSEAHNYTVPYDGHYNICGHQMHLKAGDVVKVDLTKTPTTIDHILYPSSKELPKDLFPASDMPDLIVKELSERIAIHQDYAEKTNEALSNLPSVKDLNKPKP